MNILQAIVNLKTKTNLEISNYQAGSNRVQNIGQGLEEYIKDLFADSINEGNNINRQQKLSNAFSFLGSKNRPPDAILRNGDAIEIKKIETLGGSLALNSSYPKAKVKSDSPMITQACKDCEPNPWEKDIIYIVGVVENDKLKQLQMVYGIDYAADSDVYESLKISIIDGIKSSVNIDFDETKEFARVNNVDPTNRTYLRLRGMWGIINPARAFEDYFQVENNPKFSFISVINKTKYQTFPQEDRTALEGTDGININDIQIPDPNNTANLLESKMITFKLINGEDK